MNFIDSADCSDRGKKREGNEDIVFRLPEDGVFGVADGMGGAEDGEVASAAVEGHIRRQFPDPAWAEVPLGGRVERIAAAINEASRWIYRRCSERGAEGTGRTGTTIVALVLPGRPTGRAMALHAGDSRLYGFSGGRLQCLTRDHSVAMAAGYRDEKSLPAMFRGVLTKAVGLQETVEIERTHVAFKPGDLFLLCSDGLTRMLTDRAIEKLLRRMVEAGPDALVRTLVDEANRAGGEDNVSVVLVRIRPDANLEPDAEREEESEHDTAPGGEPTLATRGLISAATLSVPGAPPPAEVEAAAEAPTPTPTPTPDRAARRPDTDAGQDAVTPVGQTPTTGGRRRRWPAGWFLLAALLLAVVLVPVLHGGRKAPGPVAQVVPGGVSPRAPVPEPAGPEPLAMEKEAQAIREETAAQKLKAEKLRQEERRQKEEQRQKDEQAQAAERERLAMEQQRKLDEAQAAADRKRVEEANAAAERQRLEKAEIARKAAAEIERKAAAAAAAKKPADEAEQNRVAVMHRETDRVAEEERQRKIAEQRRDEDARKHQEELLANAERKRREAADLISARAHLDARVGAALRDGNWEKLAAEQSRWGAGFWKDVPDRTRTAGQWGISEWTTLRDERDLPARYANATASLAEVFRALGAGATGAVPRFNQADASVRATAYLAALGGERARLTAEVHGLLEEVELWGDTPQRLESLWFFIKPPGSKEDAGSCWQHVRAARDRAPRVSEWIKTVEGEPGATELEGAPLDALSEIRRQLDAVTGSVCALMPEASRGIDSTWSDYKHLECGKNLNGVAGQVAQICVEIDQRRAGGEHRLSPAGRQQFGEFLRSMDSMVPDLQRAWEARR